MSVIFPLTNTQYTECGRCARHYPGNSIQSPILTCKCGFWMHLRDSYPNEPDHITALALRDIARQDILGFMKPFQSTIHQDALYSKNLTRTEVERQVDQRLRNSIPRDGTRRASSIRDFRRVTLCQVQWPSSRQCLISRDAWKSVDATMGNVRQCLDVIAAGSGLAFDAVARMIGGRFGRVTPDHDVYLRPIWDIYRERRPEAAELEAKGRLLAIYARSAGRFDTAYHASVVSIRCFLWIIAVILNLEARVLVGVSKLLSQICPEPRGQADPPIIMKLISPLWVPHAIIGRFTFDLVADAKDLILPDEPLYHFAIIYRVLASSRALSLTFLKDGNLDGYHLNLTPPVYFNTSIFTSDAVISRWRNTYRQQLQKVFGESFASMSQELVGWCTPRI
ncbi:hypothetical protein BJX68DRAFT_251052 [Aspergillus pseudodeflectus]|uniref:Uncharacterized protein n=1 Tax=Aspergillus pseudodeflectus TaxID=176178 RepID=A0ABR4J7W7_9EURO